MCGRYALWGIELLGGRFLVIDPEIGFRSHFNIAPGMEMPVITGSPEGNHIAPMQWGFVPHWSKDSVPSGRPIINARAESLREKPMFRMLLQQNRCIVPANGFYEWKKTEHGKEPYFIHLKDREIFGFAGLYDVWQDPAGKAIRTYTIITTEPNEVVRPIHTRMPVILKREDEMRWLAKDPPQPSALEEVLAPCAADGMAAYPVSPAVNRTTADGEELIRQRPVQKSWFS